MEGWTCCSKRVDAEQDSSENDEHVEDIYYEESIEATDSCIDMVQKTGERFTRCKCTVHNDCPYSVDKCCIENLGTEEKMLLHLKCISNNQFPQHSNKDCPCDAYLNCQREPVTDGFDNINGWTCCVPESKVKWRSEKKQSLKDCLFKHSKDKNKHGNTK